MLPVLRGNSLLPRLVNTDVGDLAAMKGDTINVPVSPTITTRNVAAAETPVASPDITISTKPVALSTWRESTFYLTDKQQAEIMDGAVPKVAEAALAALCDYVDLQIWTALKNGASRAVGTAGTTPFASLAVTLAAMEELNKNKASRTNRHVVFDPAAETNLLSLTAFASSDFVTDLDAMTEGTLGTNRRIGAQWWQNQNVGDHTAGGGTSYLVNDASLAVGDTVIAADTGSGTILVGDVVTFTADSTNKYVVTSALSGGSFSIGSPGLRVAIPDNNAITVTSASSTHVANVAFEQQSIAFASRPMQASAATITQQSMTDDVSGLTIRLEVSRQHKQDAWSFDVLFGTAVVQADGVIQILG